MNASDSPLVAFLLLLLWPLALAGLALVNTGLGRARSASQSLLGSAAIIAVSAVAFALIGVSIAAPGGLSFFIAGKPWNWAGTGPLFFSGLSSRPLDAQAQILFVFFGAAMVGMIPWGAGTDRLRLASGCAIAAILSAVVYPVFAHWTWGAGWLAQLGTNFGTAAFVDGGGGAVHAVGGLAALCVVWMVGPRRGKFPREGLATAMPAHNNAFVLFGALLTLTGFMAWNCAGALLWLHVPFTFLAVTAINTVLAAAGALLATLVVTRSRFGKPDASLCANGWLAGLVTSSACAAVVPPIAALAIGFIAGVVTPLLVEVFELALSIDDPSGAVVVHLFGGLWGLFAAGTFSRVHGQALAQLVGITALLGVILPVLYGLLALLNAIVPMRADADGERIGMDLHELGGGAYPEFVLHRDDSYR
jgi:Amt family ammonium transporter